jgi:GAF domain-containing protein
MHPELRDTQIPGLIIEIWQRVVNSAAALLSVPSVMINRLEAPDLEVFRSNVGAENPFPTGTHIPLLGLYCEQTARSGKRLQVIDARKDEVWSESPTAKAGIFAYLGYPICWPDGAIFGTLCAVDTKENKWGAEADNLLRTFRDAIEAHLALVLTVEELNKRNSELEEALREVRTLRGLLPICALCKKVRDDQGYWRQIETYVEAHSDLKLSHAICPDCANTLYPDLRLYDEEP